VLGFYIRCEQLPEDTLWELFWVLEHIAVVLGSIEGYRKAIDAHETDSAFQITLEGVNACNRLVDRMEPWKLAKQPGSERALDEVLYALAESLRIIAILISPVTPKAAHGIFDQLNWKMELSGKEARFSLADAEWGKLPDGHLVGKPTPLFPRIETEAR
jgi:methionyl-tRNA synthetase